MSVVVHAKATRTVNSMARFLINKFILLCLFSFQHAKGSRCEVLVCSTSLGRKYTPALNAFCHTSPRNLLQYGSQLTLGKLHFILHGKKLQGEWYLVRLKDQKQWLLIKGKADSKPVSKKLDDTSAASGKSMKELGNGQRILQTARN
jgi:hypothetical protein